MPPLELAECLRAAVSSKKLLDDAWNARICDQLAEQCSKGHVLDYDDIHLQFAVC